MLPSCGTMTPLPPVSNVPADPSGFRILVESCEVVTTFKGTMYSLLTICYNLTVRLRVAQALVRTFLSRSRR